MLLLVTKALPTLLRYDQRNVGRLVTPRHYPRVADTPKAGFLWAADNDAFSGFHEDRYRAMLDACEGVPGCLFVTCPDVVADADATFTLYLKWAGALLRRKLPLGYVAQDGAGVIPWDGISALFVGGSTEYKLSEDAALLVKEAKERGKWVHMGRVNTWRRIEYAKSIGCDSADGSSMSLFTDTYLPRFAEMASSPTQHQLAATPT